MKAVLADASAPDAMGIELAEQAGAWQGQWARRTEVADAARRAAAGGVPLRRVVFTGCGDCHAAAEHAAAVLGLRSGLEAWGLPAMEVSRSRPHLLGPEALLVALSVSGRTPRVLEAVRAGQRRGARVLALTDDPASPLAREAAHSLVLGASPPEALLHTDYVDPEAAEYVGYQRAVPQTKTFGALQFALSLLCVELEVLAPSARGTPREALLGDLSALGDRAAGARDVGCGAARFLFERSPPQCRVTFCGTGLAFPAARFASYKLLELARPAFCSEIEEFCHTHYLITGPGDAAVFLPHDEGSLARAHEIAAVLTAEIGAVPLVLGGGTGQWALPPACPEVVPLLLGLASASLVRELARSWGVDTDRFRAGLDEERYVRGSTRMIRHSAILDV